MLFDDRRSKVKSVLTGKLCGLRWDGEEVVRHRFSGGCRRNTKEAFLAGTVDVEYEG